jgi:hypothetical protein
MAISSLAFSNSTYVLGAGFQPPEKQLKQKPPSQLRSGRRLVHTVMTQRYYPDLVSGFLPCFFMLLTITD